MNAEIEALRAESDALEERAEQLAEESQALRQRGNDLWQRANVMERGECIPVTEVCRRYGVDRRAVMEAIEAGRLRGYVLDRKWRVYEREVEAMAAALRGTAQQEATL